MNKTADSVWNECLSFIKGKIRPQAYKTWFEIIIPISLKDNALTIQVPSKFFYEWLEENYIELIRIPLVKSLNEEAKLIYDVRMESSTFTRVPGLNELIKKGIINDESNSLDIKDKASTYDVFISHSSEDKDEFVRPLVNELKILNVKVWYDEFELKIGDSLRKAIDKGLINSKYGIVVLSTSFFNRNWTQYELNSFVNREMNGNKVILPIWHKVSKDEVQNFSLSLADKVALNSSTHSLKEIAKEISNLI